MSSPNAQNVLAYLKQVTGLHNMEVKPLEEYLSQAQIPDMAQLKQIIDRIVNATPGTSSPFGSENIQEVLDALMQRINDGAFDFLSEDPGKEWRPVNPSDPGIPSLAPVVDQPGLSSTYKGPREYFAQTDSIQTKKWRVIGAVRFDLFGWSHESNNWAIMDSFPLSRSHPPHDRSFGPNENPSGKWKLIATALAFSSSFDATPFTDSF